MVTIPAIRRFWRASEFYRQRYGTIAGLRLADQIANVTHRETSLDSVPVAVPGWRDPLWLRPNTTDVDVFKQVVVGRELELVLDPSPRRIVDGGANIGVATRVFANRWPTAEILAVEMEAANHRALLKNCEHLPSVRVRQLALWSERASVSVQHVAMYGEVGHRAVAASDGVSVPAIALEDLLDEAGWETVDLVKLDIEGAERQVFSTAPRWIDRVTHFVVELHESFSPGVTAAFDSIFDPRCWSIRPHGEYIVASRTNR